MLNIIDKKWWYFAISGIIIIPGIISLIAWGMRPAIDFTGGTLVEVKISDQKAKHASEDIRKVAQEEKLEVGTIQTTGENTYLLRLKPISTEQNIKLQSKLKEKYGEVQEVRYESVGPSIGRETTQNAAKAVVIASVFIVAYIAWAFREIPKPYSSWRFGVSAIAALIHDVLLLIGIFSLFGHFFHVEVDSLFITALLTVMGFSVHDTIVVFDRIRENLKKHIGMPFDQVANISIVQTLVRSLSTSLTVIFMLVSLLLFGGESIRWFVVALLIGMISGTYSSIFNAAPLLVVWEDWTRKRKK